MISIVVINCILVFYCVKTDGTHEISIIHRELPQNIKAERSFKQKIDASSKRNNLFFFLFLMDMHRRLGESHYVDDPPPSVS
jgi:hypothetical protein